MRTLSRTPSEHPEVEAFVRMTRGAAAPEESREIVRHLLRGCPVCSGRAEAARGAESPQGPDAYNEVFDRIERQAAEQAALLEKEREKARQLYAELLLPNHRPPPNGPKKT